MNKLFLSILFSLTACGVRGRPQAPLAAPILGRGEPSYSEATQDLKIKKKIPKKIEGDWDEPEDFEDKKEGE